MPESGYNDLGLAWSMWLWDCVMHPPNRQRTMCGSRTGLPGPLGKDVAQVEPQCNPGIPKPLGALLNRMHSALHFACRQALTSLSPPIQPHRMPITCRHTAGQEADGVTGVHRI